MGEGVCVCVGGGEAPWQHASSRGKLLQSHAAWCLNCWPQTPLWLAHPEHPTCCAAASERVLCSSLSAGRPGTAHLCCRGLLRHQQLPLLQRALPAALARGCRLCRHAPRSPAARHLPLLAWDATALLRAPCCTWGGPAAPVSLQQRGWPHPAGVSPGIDFTWWRGRGQRPGRFIHIARTPGARLPADCTMAPCTLQARQPGRRPSRTRPSQAEHSRSCVLHGQQGWCGDWVKRDVGMQYLSCKLAQSYIQHVYAVLHSEAEKALAGTRSTAFVTQFATVDRGEHVQAAPAHLRWKCLCRSPAFGSRPQWQHLCTSAPGSAAASSSCCRSRCHRRGGRAAPPCALA